MSENKIYNLWTLFLISISRAFTILTPGKVLITTEKVLIITTLNKMPITTAIPLGYREKEKKIIWLSPKTILILILTTYQAKNTTTKANPLSLTSTRKINNSKTHSETYTKPKAPPISEPKPYPNSNSSKTTTKSSVTKINNSPPNISNSKKSTNTFKISSTRPTTNSWNSSKIKFNSTHPPLHHKSLSSSLPPHNINLSFLLNLYPTTILASLMRIFISQKLKAM